LEVESRKLRLAVGGEAAAVRNGDAEVLVGVHRSIVDADFIMKMRASGTNPSSCLYERVKAAMFRANLDENAERGNVVLAEWALLMEYLL
jgi:hypothetical protein